MSSTSPPPSVINSALVSILFLRTVCMPVQPAAGHVILSIVRYVFISCLESFLFWLGVAFLLHCIHRVGSAQKSLPVKAHVRRFIAIHRRYAFGSRVGANFLVNVVPISLWHYSFEANMQMKTCGIIQNIVEKLKKALGMALATRAPTYGLPN